jgi:ribonuclease R
MRYHPPKPRSGSPVKETTGSLSFHPRGFGFLEFDDSGFPASAFIAPPELNAFLAGDVVRAQVRRADDGRWSATGLQLVERRRTTVFGQAVRRHGEMFLRIDRETANTDWRLDHAGFSRGIVEGDWVVGRVMSDQIAALRVLRADEDAGIERIITRWQLSSEFPQRALEEARLAAASPIDPTVARRDLRGLTHVTIDASSTRDIDDAIGILPADKDGAIRLIVSIADVSSAVRAGSALDEEARRRATSTYLPDRVLPMLPPELSEARLSLLPDADRECISAELRISAEGEVVAVDVYRSIIRSMARLTYDRVADFLDRSVDSGLDARVCETLTWCRTVSSRLSMSRGRRGGIEMARDEARFGVDAATGRATVLDPLRPTSAHLLIERCMVAANEAVADWVFARGVPVPYRVHDAPPADAAEGLERIARNFGFAPGFGRVLTPLALGAFDRQIQSSPAAPAMLSVLARALGPARYTVKPHPHFGLAAPRYLHFTSPLRRYADLLVHRALSAYLDGERVSDPTPAALESVCLHVTSMASRSSRAESDAHRLISARVMADHIGEEFDANITGVRPFGLRVQLRDSLLVGHVASDDIPHGPFTFAEASQELVGRSSRYSVGMPVRVRVARADEASGRLELHIVHTTGQRQPID